MRSGLDRARDARRYWPYLAVSVCFVASRWLYRHVFEIEFDATPISSFIQYMDPWFIQHDFARSLLYLHHQAPLQNLLVGGALRLLGEPTAWVALEALYLLLGFCTVMGLLHVALRLGVQQGIAAGVAALYALSPATVIYENWLLYHVPVTCCLVFSLAALIRYYRVRTFGAALCFFSTIGTAALLRSTFGPVFLLAALSLPLLALPIGAEPKTARKTLLKAFAVPFALLTLNSLKPQLLIGHGYGETVLWGNISAKMRNQLPGGELARLIADGKVSRTTTIFCLGDLNTFGTLRIPHPPTGVPLLDMERAPNGRWNAHALEYLLLTDKYYEPDARYLVSHYPVAYLESVVHAVLEYTRSSTEDSMLPWSENYQRVGRVNAVLDRVFFRRQDKSLGLLLFGLPVLLAYGVYRVLQSRKLASQRCATVALGYVLVSIGYVAGVSLLISCGDFSRYRFDLDPFHLLLLALLLSDLRRAFASALRRASAPA